MVQCMVGEGDKDNRLDLVVEEYPEQFLSRITLGSYTQYTLTEYSSKLTFPVPGGLVGSLAKFPGNSDNTHP
jgi:hypothetical protein